MAVVACPSCGRLLPSEDALAGRPLRCPVCAAAFTAPPGREAPPASSGGGPSHALTDAPSSGGAPSPAPPSKAQGLNEHLARQRAARRVFAGLALAVGVGVTAGGVYAFLGGARQASEVCFWEGLCWADGEVVFAGAAGLFAGGGLVVFGLTLLRAPGRGRRAAAWGLLAAVAAGGLGGWAAHRLTGRFPLFMTQEEHRRASAAANDYLRLGGRDRVTDDFRRRLEAAGSWTGYSGHSYQLLEDGHTRLVSRDELLLHGRVLATTKTVRRVTPAGDKDETVPVSPPRRVAYTIRLKKTGGAWRVDDYAFEE
jgi:hypothetical protein